MSLIVNQRDIIGMPLATRKFLLRKQNSVWKEEAQGFSPYKLGNKGVSLISFLEKQNQKVEASGV